MNTAEWLKPKSNRVVIRRNKEYHAKPGRLIVETKRQKPQEGMVLAIGPEVKDREMVGQCVLFMEWSGQDAPGTSGDEFITMSEEEVICEVDVALLEKMEAEQYQAQQAKEAEAATSLAAIRTETLAGLSEALKDPDSGHITLPNEPQKLTAW